VAEAGAGRHPSALRAKSEISLGGAVTTITRNEWRCECCCATKYAGEIIGDPFGYPLRLRTSTKLGYKNAKWIKAIEVTNEFRETYWSERGENWYARI